MFYCFILPTWNKVVLLLLSLLLLLIYRAVCFQFSHLPCDDWDNIYIVLLSSSNPKYELLSIV